MRPSEKCKAEGKEVLNLLLAPFVKLNLGKYNEDWGASLFFKLSARSGQHLQLQPLFQQIQIPGLEKPVYYASTVSGPAMTSIWPFCLLTSRGSYFRPSDGSFGAC